MPTKKDEAQQAQQQQTPDTEQKTNEAGASNETAGTQSSSGANSPADVIANAGASGPADAAQGAAPQTETTPEAKAPETKPAEERAAADTDDSKALWHQVDPLRRLERLRLAQLALAASLANTNDVSAVREILA